MRALAGPACLLVIVGSVALYRSMQQPKSPPRDFLELEFAGADAGRTGSCYSLSTVLVAHTALQDFVLGWQPPDDGEDAWTLTIESLHQAPNGGPLHSVRRYTFERVEQSVRLVAVAAPEGTPGDVNTHIDLLLDSPHERRSTPVDRCQVPGARGYRFARG